MIRAGSSAGRGSDHHVAPPSGKRSAAMTTAKAVRIWRAVGEGMSRDGAAQHGTGR